MQLRRGGAGWEGEGPCSFGVAARAGKARGRCFSHGAHEGRTMAEIAGGRQAAAGNEQLGGAAVMRPERYPLHMILGACHTYISRAVRYIGHVCKHARNTHTCTRAKCTHATSTHARVQYKCMQQAHMHECDMHAYDTHTCTRTPLGIQRPRATFMHATSTHARRAHTLRPARLLLAALLWRLADGALQVEL